MSKAPSLRERKKARTREALIGAAIDLFCRKGFEETTVDEVAEAAGVSRRTFFRYFPTKEAVVFPDKDRRLQALRSMLERRHPDETPLAAVGRALLTLAGEFVQQREQVQQQHQIIIASPTLIAHEQRLDADWEQALAEALTTGTGSRARRRARIMAGAIIGTIRATLHTWLETDCRDDLLELGRESMELLAEGFQGIQGE